jgi:hypothetical protein
MASAQLERLIMTTPKPTRKARPVRARKMYAAPEQVHPSLGSDYVDDWLGRKLPEERTDGVYAGCDENRGHLNTGEDFGCVHFQHNGSDQPPARG